MSTASHNSAIEQGSRLRSARETVGFSTREFAKLLLAHDITISHATIGNYESGKTEIPDSVLLAYSELCLRPIEWLRGEGNRLSGARYRALKSTRVREKNSFEGKAESLLNGVLWLEGITGRRIRNRLLSSFRPKDSWDGKVLAIHLRKVLKLGLYPVPSVTKLLFFCGVRVIEVKASDKIDALAARLGAQPAIAVNKVLSPDRTRLTLLHELAHILFSDCGAEHRLGHDEIESRAFDFASHFLIPQAELKKAIKTNSMIEMVKCKERFGISLAAVIYRAHQSKLINGSVYRRIMMEFSKLGYRKNEPGRVVEDRPCWFEVLADSAVRNTKTSLDEIARRSGLRQSELVIRLNDAAGVVPFDELESEVESAPSSFKFIHYQKGLDT